MKSHIALQSLKRPRFFDGRLLTAAEFNLEQTYVLEKFKRHNRSLHGFGIVSGLNVTVESGKVQVSPGLASDCSGNELIVDSDQSVNLTGLVGLRTAYLGVRYFEKCVDPLPVESDRIEHANVLESFELSFTAENTNRGHRHLHGRWLPCGQSHELTIAILKATPSGWRVDRRYRSPAIK